MHPFEIPYSLVRRFFLELAVETGVAVAGELAAVVEGAVDDQFGVESHQAGQACEQGDPMFARSDAATVRQESGVLAGAAADFLHLVAIGEVLAQHVKDRFPLLFAGRGVGLFHGGLESISRHDRRSGYARLESPGPKSSIASVALISLRSVSVTRLNSLRSSRMLSAISSSRAPAEIPDQAAEVGFLELLFPKCWH